MLVSSRVSLGAVVNVNSAAVNEEDRATHSFDEGTFGSAGDIDGADFESTREVLRAARWSLSSDGGGEGEESYGVLHGVLECVSRGRYKGKQEDGKINYDKSNAEAIYAAGSE